MENNSAPIPKKSTLKRLSGLIVITIIAVPLGILAAGVAYGEWGSEELLKLFGYVPSGIEQGERLWQAPFQDYGFANLDPNAAYWLSAIIGVMIIFVVLWGIGKLIAKKGVQTNGSA